MDQHRLAGMLARGAMAAVLALALSVGTSARGQGTEHENAPTAPQPPEPATTRAATTPPAEPSAPPAEPAAPQRPAEELDQGTYWLRVTAGQLNIRSRADLNSPVVFRVPRDTLLRATGEADGWHAILPPEGVFSYISAEFIDRRGDDVGVVSVRSGRLRVRVGSLVVNLDPTRSEVQALLERGARVKVLGEEDGWLRIAPPEDVRVYVHGDFVEPLTDEAARRLLQSQRAAVAEVVTSTQPAVAAGLQGPWGQKLRQIEEDIAKQAAKPPLARSWQPLIGRLRPIAWQREELLPARLAEAWIEKLERRVAEQAAWQAAEEIMRRAERERRQHEQEMERIDRLRAAAMGQPLYDARGRFMRSYALRGEDDADRWFKLVDPVTQWLEAYVHIPLDVELDPERYLGRHVGVEGERRFDPDLGADVIRARRIGLLRLQPPATQPSTEGR